MGISFEKVQKEAPGLVDKFAKAQEAVQSIPNLDGVTADVYLVIDDSPSMDELYDNGTVQDFNERAFVTALQFDRDGKLPTGFFSGGASRLTDMKLKNYQGFVNRHRLPSRDRNGTNYVAGMERVIKAHRGKKTPALVIFQTDGEPNRPYDPRLAVVKLLSEVSSLPIFWQFVGFGYNPDGFDFLKKLDKLEEHYPTYPQDVDNANFFDGNELATPDELYGKFMQEFPSWLRAARAAGIVRS